MKLFNKTFVTSVISFLFISHGIVAARAHLRGAAREYPPPAEQQENNKRHRVLVRSQNGMPTFIKGKLGQVNLHHGLRSEPAFKVSAQQTLKSLLVDTFGTTGHEEIVPTSHKVYKDREGKSHIRFQEVIHGMPVEGSAILMHVDKTGTVFAVNGEVVSDADVPKEPEMDCDAALAIALEQSEIQGSEWLTPCELSVVYGNDGHGHLAWKRMVGYKLKSGPSQKDVLFASALSGDLVARHPKVYGALSLDTRNCGNSTMFCETVSTSPNRINTGDAAVDAAHNHAIATYNFYFSQYGRDSIDDNGMTIISRAHYDSGYNNAFWDGTQVTYGDGDGDRFHELSRDADVVAHEITHGITEASSALVYYSESGALNEGISDIFAAAVDRQEGASVADTFLIGEGIYTPSTPGDALRHMADPAADGLSYDFYPDRYVGNEDNGGVHLNSGIINLAFALLVNGGQHPRNKTAIQVPAIASDFDESLLEAAKIFYYANTACLTPYSDFAAARYCTADIHGGAHSELVHAAWDAVGVPNEPPPDEPIALTDGVPATDQAAQTGYIHGYILEGIAAGDRVTCSLSGNNGDADLYTRFGSAAFPSPSYPENACSSTGSTSNEECTTNQADSDTELWITVAAPSAYTGLSVTCAINSSPTSSETIVLTNGVAVTDQAAQIGGVKTYVLNGVTTGDTVTCLLSGSNGDADMYLRFGAAAVPYVSTENECSSRSLSSNEECTTGQADSDTELWVAVKAHTSYSGLSVMCEIDASASSGTISLQDGVPLSKQAAAMGNVQLYTLQDIAAGNNVTCSLSGSNGDADLYVRYGAEPVVDPKAAENDCTSHGLSSNEECTAGPATLDEVLWVAVHAHGNYTNLTIACTTDTRE